MTTISHPALKSADALRKMPHGGLSNWLRSCMARLLRALDRHRQRRILRELDDHLLMDIGVSRQQAFEESRRPIWR